MRADMRKRVQSLFAKFAGGLVVIGGFYTVLADHGSSPAQAESEIQALSTRWVSAIAARDPGFVDLLSASAIEHYERLRDVALHGDVSALDALGPTDQLQALFLRLMIEPGKLQAMSGREILALAVDQRWIGQDLPEWHRNRSALQVRARRSPGSRPAVFSLRKRSLARGSSR